jgi:cytochrome c biogenesis protein CcmG/thiol:disulfide interchange protein DsbE
MPEAFSIGPFLIPTRTAGFLLMALLALWIVHRVANYLKTDFNLCVRIGEQGLWVGIVASRLSFALLNWSSFSAKPWSVLYLWQPGYSFSAGIITALAHILYRIYRQEAKQRRAIISSLSAGFTLPVLLFIGMLLTINQFVDTEIFIPGDTVPGDRVTADLYGKPVSFADFSGKGLVINFWATWCPPCRREMPLLEEVYDKYKSKGIVVIGVAMDGSPEAIRNYIESVGVTYPIWGNIMANNSGVSSGASLSNMFGVVGFPTTFFVDADGVIQSSYVGELNLAILNNRIPELMP